MSFAFKALASKRALLTGSAIATTALSYNYFTQTPTSIVSNDADLPPLIQSRPTPPSREELLKKLETTPNFDVLIIGGGATGTGSAVDAATRGLNVALVERNDFASGTSSKSTKMAHGGVRYLEKAVWQFSKAQLDLVIEALNERNNMIKTAPHLVTVLPILIPVYTYWQIPYFYVGTKMYDIFAGRQNLRSSYLMGQEKTLAFAPNLDPTHLKAGLVYHDGSFNDSRLNASLAVTAIENGATALNYVEVTQLLKKDGKTIGALAKDRETGKEYTIKAKTVVNATGPFSDIILDMDKDPQGIAPKEIQKPKMVVPSSGVHIVLPEYYAPKQLGILDASTSDGRVMFFLPWQGKVLAGTTDVPLDKVPENPVPTEADIQDILQELQHYIRFPVKREDVLSAWSGIRPLVRDPRKANTGGTQNLVRNHLLFTSESGLITISGGKWTTYREMAEETINEVVKNGQFPVKGSVTKNLILAGGENYEKTLAPRLAQKYQITGGLAEHLAANYGTRAPLILELYKQDVENQVPVALAASKELRSFEAFEHPFSVAELKYGIKYEYVRTPADFLARRTRLAFLDSKAAQRSIDGVVKVLGDELNWDEAKRAEETQKTVEFVKTFN
ncbi:glycerol-3-phosphate dehydrogenase [Wickerhamomyces ciferrii]|uniref:Glycerol-3-phosphate dehydrogenase n=1 Tax=Wickerhamomyces ciferrii (strain ATCC 14091 / BCRC 22168 / CBS 111 / JCM 3599 / NBRC 0793 / NRRL Y-1031 F-60-10) TaxID=1206466 RepID=K0KJ80_WICCF|nr:glycerol-3-phosphate dehydrogenase [Wickerhamomyces ciferrii]CCH43036.1 glycerol-3-phosphate dehydrogenase [Wickerhamomyces ciferrii]